jgi:hypothetical protein
MCRRNTFSDRTTSSAELALSAALDHKHFAALQRLERGALDDSFRVVPDRAVRQILIPIIKKSNKLYFTFHNQIAAPSFSRISNKKT